MKTGLDDTDRRLLNLIQGEFPLTSEPFSALGLALGVSGEQVIRRIEGLKAGGIVRYIGPLFDARSLGYHITLVAMRVAEQRLDEATQVVCEHPGVSHGYQRDHHFNLWFTLALPWERDIQDELGRLAGVLAAEAVLDLPVLRAFKLGTCFDVGGDATPTADASVAYRVSFAKAPDLSPSDRALIKELQRDLPLIPRPFDTTAERLGIDTDEFLAHCQSLLQRSVMRRFSASVSHARLGFVANAMVCWIASPDRVEAAGQKLAALREVSHCFERKANSIWPYNLFAMIHGRTREACQEIARKVSRQSGLRDYEVLFSSKEFKKARVKYLV